MLRLNRRPLRRLFAAALLSALAADGIAEAAPGSFANGDIFLVSPAIPARGLTKRGILRYVPGSGAAVPLVFFDNSSFGAGTSPNESAATYEPTRDRILLPASSTVLGTVDSDGVLGTISLPNVQSIRLLAAAPGGRVYFVAGSQLFVMDQNDQVTVVKDPSGTIPFTSPLVGEANGCIYDIGTSSLILADLTSPFVGTMFVRLPIAANGTQLAGPPLTSTIDLVPGQLEVVAGMSKGPNGLIIVSCDVNANGAFPLLSAFNPVSMTATPYATCAYEINGGLTTSTYSPTLGKAVSLDTFNDQLRGWSAGEAGPGTILASAVSQSGSSAEAARLMTIGGTINGTVVVPGDIDGNGQVDAADLASLLGAWGACGNCANCAGDLDQDCDVDAADLSILLGNWG